MKETILITGATGVLGRAIVEAALKSGMGVRLGVRDPQKARPDAAAVRLDYADPASIPGAMAGVSGLVLIAPPLDPNAAALLAPVVAAAKTAGVRHVVFISAFGANHNEQAPLRVIEHMVMDSGIACTILRPNFFMENFSEGFLAEGIKTQGAIFLAAGDARTSFISVRDIAAAAVAAFERPLPGREFDLTGPEALDHAEAARLIAEASGRPVVYHALTEEQMIAGVRALGMPETAIAYLAVLYAAVRAGHAAAITDGVAKITGRRALSFREFAQAAAGSFTPRA